MLLKSLVISGGESQVPVGWRAAQLMMIDIAKHPGRRLRQGSGSLPRGLQAKCGNRGSYSRDLWPEQEPRQTRRIVSEHNYTDEGGHLLYQVVRTDPKGFFQRQPDGHGRWINKKGRHQVLYRLREVLESPIVFVCEGEKDVETLREHGFVATTNAGGAEAPWLPGHTEALRGREIILPPDRDRPGRERVARIARSLIGNVARARSTVSWLLQP